MARRANFLRSVLLETTELTERRPDVLSIRANDANNRMPGERGCRRQLFPAMLDSAGPGRTRKGILAHADDRSPGCGSPILGERRVGGIVSSETGSSVRRYTSISVRTCCPGILRVTEQFCIR